jgi:hypothetical protein
MSTGTVAYAMRPSAALEAISLQKHEFRLITLLKIVDKFNIGPAVKLQATYI